MKCTVRFEIDGDPDFFVVEQRGAVRCVNMLNSEVERRGLEQVKNNILIDVVFENKRSAWFLGIPCWYYVDTGDIEGRNFFYGILYNVMDVVTLLVSSLSEFVTGERVQFKIKCMEME